MTIAYAWLDLAQPDARWPARAEREMQRVRRALGTCCQAVHHVGSTSVAGLPAVPIVDLMVELDDTGLYGDSGLHNVGRLRLLAHGFTGVAAPSHCAVFVVEDVLSDCRTVELMLYPLGHEEVRVAVAFFACLRIQPDLAVAYGEMKLQARSWHGAGTSGYAAEKRAWMQQNTRPSHALPLRPAG